MPDQHPLARKRIRDESIRCCVTTGAHKSGFRVISGIPPLAQERWPIVNVEARRQLDLLPFQLTCDNLPGLGASRPAGAAIRGACC